MVEDALACWRERRALEADPETLRRLWHEGQDNGEPEPLDMAEIKRAARAKAKAPEIDVALYQPA